MAYRQPQEYSFCEEILLTCLLTAIAPSPASHQLRHCVTRSWGGCSQVGNDLNTLYYAVVKQRVLQFHTAGLPSLFILFIYLFVSLCIYLFGIDSAELHRVLQLLQLLFFFSFFFFVSFCYMVANLLAFYLLFWFRPDTKYTTYSRLYSSCTAAWNFLRP